MNVQTEATKTDDRETRIQAARDSFSGRTLTDSQFKEAWALSRVLQGEIQKTGSFREKLTDYAHAYGRSEKFDALRGETILRDIYTARYGQSMNQTREGLLAAAENLPANAKTLALNAAESIGEQIQQAPTQPFYMAYDNAAVALATELKITQSGAKALMQEAYREVHDRDLYAAGKEVEEAYHRPVREAEIAARKAEQLQTRSQSQSRS